jgi:hypothetical protein
MSSSRLLRSLGSPGITPDPHLHRTGFAPGSGAALPAIASSGKILKSIGASPKSIGGSLDGSAARLYGLAACRFPLTALPCPLAAGDERWALAKTHRRLASSH